VFVASPGDVADARRRLRDVVDELNTTWSREIRLRLDLIRWETHAFPDKATDAQEVINRQLSEHDIFLGIMWKRFGQPTGRARSGTEEEFARALEKHEADPRSLRIMFYFKDAPPARLSDVDPQELKRVKRFHARVARAGVLYRTYSGLGEFEKHVRHDLSRQVQEWGKTWGGVIEEPVRPRVSPVPTVEANEDGLPPEGETQARSVTAIVFEEMARAGPLRPRAGHDPEVIQRSFLEAQLILDSSPAEDELAHLAAQQATALVAVALESRLAPGKAAQAHVARVCERIMGLRGLRIDWGKRGTQALHALLGMARDRHDDDVLMWIRRHTRQME